MLTANTSYDPKQMVRLKSVRPLFVHGKRVEVGEEFEVQAQHAAEILITLRAEFVNQSDRPLVYKQVEVYA